MKRFGEYAFAAVLGVVCAAGATAQAQNYPTPAWPDPNPNPTYLNPCFDNSSGGVGNEALTIVVITPTQYEGTQPDGSPGFDALWASHAQFWRMTHGPGLYKGAGLTYSVDKGQQLSNPLDPSSAPTGNDMYVLHECYPADYDKDATLPLTAQNDNILEHWAYTAANWSGFNQLIALMQKPGVTVVTLHHGQVVHASWHADDGVSPALLPPWLY